MQPIRKKDSRWMLYAGGTAFAILAVFLLEASMFIYGVWNGPILFPILAIALPMLLLLGVVLVLTLGTKIFPWRYSVFGPYDRSLPPKGFQPHIRLSIAPSPQHHFISQLEIGREGIELTFSWQTLFGQKQTRAFLPASAITAIGPAAWRTYVVEHDSLEIESPLVVSQEVGEAIIAGFEGSKTPPTPLRTSG